MLEQGLLEIDGSPAPRCPTSARDIFDFFGKVVVDRKFFAFADGPRAHIKNVASLDDGLDVGIAAVIYVLRAAATDGAIESPVVIQCEQVDFIALFLAATLSFLAADLLAGVLNYLPAGGDVLTGVDTPAMNLRGFQNKLEVGISRIDFRYLNRLHWRHLRNCSDARPHLRRAMFRNACRRCTSAVHR
jgi:hypothetical protein